MKIFEWFKQIVSGEQLAPSEMITQEAATAAKPRIEETGEFAGLDFKTAIDAHVKWKVRLDHYINGTSDEDLKVDTVSRDDQCMLGKWIHSDVSQQFADIREFQEMKMEHARFHLAAGDILSCSQAGDKEGALDKLHHGDYAKASERVKLFLARLYVKLVH